MKGFLMWVSRYLQKRFVAIWA